MILKNTEEIKKVLENDGVIAYVTDTVWGLKKSMRLRNVRHKNH